MKKYSFIIVILILLFLLVYFFVRPKNYEINYIVNDASVKEKYIKKDKLYLITIKKDKNTFKYYIKGKYYLKKHLINKINTKKIDKTTCITPKSDKLDIYTLCKNKTNYVAIPYNDNKQKPINKISNINVYNYKNKNYLLWNYKYLLFLNKENNKKIKISNKDIYNLKNPYYTDKYLFIPKQDNEYSYNKAFIITGENGKKRHISFNNDLYFDSYYLGSIKDTIYLFDRKNKQEYKINLNNQKTEKIKSQILENGKWNLVSNNKLMSKKYTFVYDKLINYNLDNTKLYANINNDYNILIDNKVSYIVKENNTSIYYLKNDKLYFYDFYKGKEKLMEYSEWQFNYTDMIFIFD